MNNIIKRTWKQNGMVQIEDLRGQTFQNESGGHTFVIRGEDEDGNQIALSGSPAGVFLRPDNTDQALTCSISDGMVYATLPAACYDVPGRAGITIYLTSGGQKTALYAAMVSVGRTSTGTVAPGTTADVVDLINRINEVVATIPQDYSDLSNNVEDYNLQYSVVFSANYAFVPCFIPAGSVVTAEAITGNFNDGQIAFYDASKTEVTSLALWSITSSRKKELSSDIYYVVVSGETPSNIRLSPVFDCKNMRNVLDTVSSYFATVGGGGKLEYDTANYKVNFGNNALVIYVNGTGIVLNNATIKTQLGNKADDSSGTLIITVGENHSLVYDVSESTLKVIANGNFDFTKHIPLFSTRYENGNGGLLVTSSNSVYARESSSFISEYQKTLKSSYAYITGGGVAQYDQDAGTLNIGLNSIGLVINGSLFSINHSTIISQLGASKAAEDSSGNLIITIGQSNALIYSIQEQKLKIVQITNVNEQSNVLLFSTYFYSGNVGLLSESNDSIRIRQREQFEYKNVINSAPDYVKASFFDNLKRFNANVANAGLTSERFLFFTDPHCFVDTDFEDWMAGMMATLQKYYNSTPTDFVICGGDWTGQDTLDVAYEKMGYIYGLGKSILGGDNFYNIVGNHDTNYQGSQQLTENQIRNLWYDGGKCYYKVKRTNCTYFFLDTGVDNDDEMDSYRYEQLKWLCSELVDEIGTKTRYAIGMHIIRNDPDPTIITPMAELVGYIIDAYNSADTITIDEETFDFTDNTGDNAGKIYFVLGGHMHLDGNLTLGGVPCVLTINTARKSTSSTNTGKNVANFDLCVADFENGKLKMTRVGIGEDRTFNI